MSDGLLPVFGLLQRRLLSNGARLRRHVLSDGRLLRPGLQRRDRPRRFGRDRLWRSSEWKRKWERECNRATYNDRHDDDGGGKCGEWRRGSRSRKWELRVGVV